jgi:hypothetical protein
MLHFNFCRRLLVFLRVLLLIQAQEEVLVILTFLGSILVVSLDVTVQVFLGDLVLLVHLPVCGHVQAGLVVLQGAVW